MFIIKNQSQNDLKNDNKKFSPSTICSQYNKYFKQKKRQDYISAIRKQNQIPFHWKKQSSSQIFTFFKQNNNSQIILNIIFDISKQINWRFYSELIICGLEKIRQLQLQYSIPIVSNKQLLHFFCLHDQSIICVTLRILKNCFKLNPYNYPVQNIIGIISSRVIDKFKMEIDIEAFWILATLIQMLQEIKFQKISFKRIIDAIGKIDNEGLIAGLVFLNNLLVISPIHCTFMIRVKCFYQIILKGLSTNNRDMINQSLLLISNGIVKLKGFLEYVCENMDIMYLIRIICISEYQLEYRILLLYNLMIKQTQGNRGIIIMKLKQSQHALQFVFKFCNQFVTPQSKFIKQVLF